MEFEGVVYKILPLTQGTSARGEWQRHRASCSGDDRRPRPAGDGSGCVHPQQADRKRTELIFRTSGASRSSVPGAPFFAPSNVHKPFISLFTQSMV